MMTYARFYSLQERLRLDVSFLSLNSFSINSEFSFQRELYAFKATHFFFFNFEIVTILNCFNNAMSIIIRIVDMMFFRVFKILIIFIVLISLLNRIYKFRQFVSSRHCQETPIMFREHSQTLPIMKVTQTIVYVYTIVAIEFA